MKPEDLLRETMRNAAAREPSSGDAWARFQAARRRSILRRTAIAVATGVGAIAALVFTLPGINPGPGSDFAGEGTTTPSARPRDMREYVDAQARYRVLYPAEWQSARVDHPSGSAIAFMPGVAREPMAAASACPGCAPMRETPRAYYVQVRAQNGACPQPWRQRFEVARPCPSMRAAFGDYLDARARAGVYVSRAEIVIDGRRWIEAVSIFPDRAPPSRARDVDYWCRGCRITEHVAQWTGGWAIDVRAVAPDDASDQRWSRDAAGILRSLDRAR